MKTVVLIPGPSSVENLWMLKIIPLIVDSKTKPRRTALASQF